MKQRFSIVFNDMTVLNATTKNGTVYNRKDPITIQVELSETEMNALHDAGENITLYALDYLYDKLKKHLENEYTI